MSLKQRRLGGQGVVVSEIGLGCMGMSYAYSGQDDAESVATIHRALDLGVTFFDTAEVYGPYTNERLLGKALGERRKDVVVATKFGFKIDGQRRVVGLDSRPEHIRAAVHESLSRLRTDYIDLVYQHRVDRSVPIEDVAGAVAELAREGKVKYFGLSEAAPETVRKAHAVCPVSVVQSEYSLWERAVESDLLPALEELGIGFVAYSPLGRGFLTGGAQRAEDYPEVDYRRLDPRYQGQNYDANASILKTVSAIAAQMEATPAQVALAWLLAKSPHIVPIPGTKKRKWLEQNLRAAQLTLTSVELAQLHDVVREHPVTGARYEASMMKLVNR